MSHENFRGLAHRQKIFGSVKGALAEFAALITRCLGLKNKAGIVTAFLTFDLVGVLHARK